MGQLSKDEIAGLGQLFKVVDAKNRVAITFGDLRGSYWRCCTEFGGQKNSDIMESGNMRYFSCLTHGGCKSVTKHFLVEAF